MYVGRKYFTARLKGQIKESDWKRYYGSCKPLKEDIKVLGATSFDRRILGVYETKGQVNYAEVAEMFARDVLRAKLPNGKRAYYNGHILARWFQQNHSDEAPAGFIHSEESKDKMAAKHRGMKHSEATKAKIAESGRMVQKIYTDEGRNRISAAARNRTPNPEAVARSAAARRGRVSSEETRQRISAAKKGKASSLPTAEHRAKLAESNRRTPLETIRGIKEDIASGMKDIECAEKWGKRRGYIGDIRTGRLWGSLQL